MKIDEGFFPEELTRIENVPFLFVIDFVSIFAIELVLFEEKYSGGVYHGYL